MIEPLDKPRTPIVGNGAGLTEREAASALERYISDRAGHRADGGVSIFDEPEVGDPNGEQTRPTSTSNGADTQQQAEPADKPLPEVVKAPASDTSDPLAGIEEDPDLPPPVGPAQKQQTEAERQAAQEAMYAPVTEQERTGVEQESARLAQYTRDVQEQARHLDAAMQRGELSHGEIAMYQQKLQAAGAEIQQYQQHLGQVALQQTLRQVMNDPSGVGHDWNPIRSGRNTPQGLASIWLEIQALGHVMSEQGYADEQIYMMTARQVAAAKRRFGSRIPAKARELARHQGVDYLPADADIDYRPSPSEVDALARQGLPRGVDPGHQHRQEAKRKLQVVKSERKKSDTPGPRSRQAAMNALDRSLPISDFSEREMAERLISSGLIDKL